MEKEDGLILVELPPQVRQALATQAAAYPMGDEEYAAQLLRASVEGMAQTSEPQVEAPQEETSTEELTPAAQMCRDAMGLRACRQLIDEICQKFQSFGFDTSEGNIENFYVFTDRLCEEGGLSLAQNALERLGHAKDEEEDEGEEEETSSRNRTKFDDTGAVEALQALHARGEKYIPASAIANEMGRSHNAMARLLLALERRGLLSRSGEYPASRGVKGGIRWRINAETLETWTEKNELPEETLSKEDTGDDEEVSVDNEQAPESDELEDEDNGEADRYQVFVPGSNKPLKGTFTVKQLGDAVIAGELPADARVVKVEDDEEVASLDGIPEKEDHWGAVLAEAFDKDEEEKAQAPVVDPEEEARLLKEAARLAEEARVAAEEAAILAELQAEEDRNRLAAEAETARLAEIARVNAEREREARRLEREAEKVRAAEAARLANEERERQEEEARLAAETERQRAADEIEKARQIAEAQFNGLVNEYNGTFEAKGELGEYDKAVKEDAIRACVPARFKQKTDDLNTEGWLANHLYLWGGDSFDFTIRYKLLKLGPVSKPVWDALSNDEMDYKQAWKVLSKYKRAITKKKEKGSLVGADLMQKIVGDVLDPPPDSNPGSQEDLDDAPMSVAPPSEPLTTDHWLLADEPKPGVIKRSLRLKSGEARLLIPPPPELTPSLASINPSPTAKEIEAEMRDIKERRERLLIRREIVLAYVDSYNKPMNDRQLITSVAMVLPKAHHPVVLAERALMIREGLVVPASKKGYYILDKNLALDVAGIVESKIKTANP